MTLEINNIQSLSSNKKFDLNNDLEDGEIEDELSDVECKEQICQSESLQVTSVETNNLRCHITFSSENDVSGNRTKTSQVKLESYNCIPSLNAPVVHSIECSSSHKIINESQFHVHTSVAKCRRSVECKDNKMDVNDRNVNTCLCQAPISVSKRKREDKTDKFECQSSKKQLTHGNKSGFHRIGSTEEELEEDEMIFVRGASPVLRNHHADPPTVIPHRSLRTERCVKINELDDNRKVNHRRTKPTKSEGSKSRSSTKRTKSTDSRSCSFKKKHKKRHRKEKNTETNRKMKLCKFYLLDTCTKKPTCQYMHSEFPCKFFHTGLKCFAGERCKFSHGLLTEELKILLLKHLETAPKEFLGDFPRLSRDGVSKMISRRTDKKGNELTKTIPSLLEIRIPTPPEFQVNNHGMNMNNGVFSSTGTGTDTTYDIGLPDEEMPVAGSLTPMPGSPKFDALDLSEQSFAVGDKKCVKTNKEVNKLDKLTETDKLCKALDNNSGISISSSKFTKIKTAGGVNSEQQIKNAIDMPSNLPKKQRELFLRIQQQQREVVNSEPEDILEKINKQEINNDNTMKEDNWYSSDDEDVNLANILKNLPNKPSSSNVTDKTLPFGFQSSTTGTGTSSAVGLPKQETAFSNTISQKGITESMGKLLTTIKLVQCNIVTINKNRSTTTKPNIGLLGTCARDPRLAQRNSMSPSVTAALWSPLSQTEITMENNPINLDLPVHKSSAGIPVLLPLSNFKSKTSDYSSESSLSNLGSKDVDLRRQSGLSSETDKNITYQPNWLNPSGVSTILHPERSYQYHKANLNRDVDLREIMGLPFSPVPTHKPATEIDASFASHPPIPYKLHPITLPSPNYTNIKSYNNLTGDQKVLTDPRLRKLFNFDDAENHTIKSFGLPTTPELKSYKEINFPSVLNAPCCSKEVTTISSSTNMSYSLQNSKNTTFVSSNLSSSNNPNFDQTNSKYAFVPVYSNIRDSFQKSKIICDKDNRVLYPHRPTNCNVSAVCLKNDRMTTLDKIGEN